MRLSPRLPTTGIEAVRLLTRRSAVSRTNHENTKVRKREKESEDGSSLRDRVTESDRLFSFRDFVLSCFRDCFRLERLLESQRARLVAARPRWVLCVRVVKLFMNHPDKARV